MWITDSVALNQQPSSPMEVVANQRGPSYRNLPVAAPFISLDYFMHNQIKINPKANVEFMNGDFMRIVEVIQDTRTMEINLRGWLFRRTLKMNNQMEKKKNELCWIQRIDQDDERIHKVQAMESRSVDDVFRRRRIRLTNRPFPDLSYREDPRGQSDEEVINKRELVCRTKYISFYKTTKDRQSDLSCEKAFERLRADECDQSSGIGDDVCAVSDDILREIWRGNTASGGACKAWSYGEERFLKLEFNDHWAGRNYFQTRQQRSSMKVDRVGNLVTDLNPSHLQRHLSPDYEIINSSPSDHANALARSIPATTERRNITSTSKMDSTGEASGLARNPVNLDINPSKVCDTARNSSRGLPAMDERRNTQSTPIVDPIVEASGLQRSAVDPSTNLKDVRVAATHFPRGKKRSGTDLLEEEGERLKSLRISGPAESRAVANMPRRSAGHRYTFGDAFCGAGGTSRGAVMAGLRVQWGFDMDLHACKSYARNFYGATIYNMTADLFMSFSERQDIKVDIAHFSPPCCPFSPAHTTSGKNDEANQAALFAVQQLLLKTKPRVVTLEQTAGLESRHPEYFNSLIHIFTSNDYSVRWKTLNMAEYGLPQVRKRVIIIASCPGEVLPLFPHSTHSNDRLRGLKPLTTIAEAIDEIPRGWANHNLDRVRARNEPAQSGNRQARTMTTSGAGIVHPNGKRSLTYREYACLQGFGLEHKFGQHGILKQLGNAVPPLVASILFESIKKALMKADGLSDD